MGLGIAAVLPASDTWLVKAGRWSPEQHARESAAGFVARASFAIVSQGDLPPPGGEREGLTIGVDPDPDAFDAELSTLSPLTDVTIRWRDRENAPFLVDWYLHGPRGATPTDAHAVQVASLDLRKFLHTSAPDIVITDQAARLQAHLAEFSRKEKILYPSTGSRPRDPAWSKIATLRLINNCREPGNYEIALRDWVGRKLYKASFSLPYPVYDEIVRHHTGLGLVDIGTGIRVPWTVALRNPLRHWRSLLPGWREKRFPEVGLEHLGLGAEEVPRVRGEIEVAGGRIPYEEFEIEVRHKSSFRLPSEPLSYVRVDSALPVPDGFEAPDRGSPAAYWGDPRNRGKVVSHRFHRFDDLRRYAVFLSGFEASGVYVGKSDLEEYDKERRSGRWPFDFTAVAGLRRFDLTRSETGYLQIRLLGEDRPGAVHVALGLPDLPVGQAVDFPLGIAVQPLVADYDSDVRQPRPRYALAYDAEGRVLDHHRLDIGVERVRVARPEPNTLRIGLISHERIVPVFVGEIRAAPGDGSPATSGSIEVRQDRA